MKLLLEIGSRMYLIDLQHPIDLSIPLRFNSEQPGFFGAPPATAEPLDSKTFVGDVRLGGACNVEEYRLIPHCNGTHTECVGHISRERISIHEMLRQSLIPATVITVQPEPGKSCKDSYDPPLEPYDQVITRSALESALAGADRDFLQALIIRTLPNDDSKLTRNYDENPAPFFSLEAMEYVVQLDVQHLLVDIPSLDRASDKGKMSAHHVFWGVLQGGHEVDPLNASSRTVTELIYAPNTVDDGRYLLNLQIPALMADAAPSRVAAYGVEEIAG